MSGPLQGGSSQFAALVVYRASPQNPARSSQFFAMAVMTPHQTPYAKASQQQALVVYAVTPNALARASRLLGLVVYGLGTGTETISRAWSFNLDGHTFYVLNLGATGTFLYDLTTQQWCRFQTDGHDGWNIINGAEFGPQPRIVGGDMLNGLVWELDPDATEDEGFRPITHIATAGVPSRSRVYMSVEALRLAGSIASLDSEAATAVTMNFSDDNGNTWSDDFAVTLTPGDYSGEVAWRSLGSFMAPGRIFRITDVGGMLRLDGADVFISNFDGEDLLKNQENSYYTKLFNQNG